MSQKNGKNDKNIGINIKRNVIEKQTDWKML